MQGREPVLTHVKHEFDPVFDGQSEILILGTLPSVGAEILLRTSAQPLLGGDRRALRRESPGDNRGEEGTFAGTSHRPVGRYRGV